METPLLYISNLGKAYPGPNGPAVIVKDFNLKVKKGEFVCIIGHSGCGKSTVLSIVMGLNEPSLGGVALDGIEIDGPGTDRGVVFQSPSLYPWFTAAENVMLAIGQVQPKLSSKEKKSVAEKYLERVGLGDMADHYPEEMSAGMRQRVGIARAFAMDPKLLLLDEPFSLLDALTRMELQDEVIRLWDEEHKTVLMVTHDVDEALLLADRIVMMTSGPAATIGEILTVPFAHPRKRADLLAQPDYFKVRDYVIGFLENQGHPTKEKELPPESVPTPYDLANEETARVVMAPMMATE